MFRERENGSSKTGAIGRAIDSLTLINGIGERFKYELKEEKVINFTPLLRRVNNKINPISAMREILYVPGSGLHYTKILPFDFEKDDPIPAGAGVAEEIFLYPILLNEQRLIQLWEIDRGLVRYLAGLTPEKIESVFQSGTTRK